MSINNNTTTTNNNNQMIGSERIKLTSASGQRLREAQHINKSLSSLGFINIFHQYIYIYI